jgi:hypothetical protein
MHAPAAWDIDREATGLPLVDGTRHILDVMKRHGVTRYTATGHPQRPRPHPSVHAARRHINA